MNLDIRKHGRYIIVDLMENIDISNSSECRTFFQKLLDEGREYVVLNFINTTIIDSAGIGVLITFEKKYRALNYEFALMNLNERLEEYFNIAGLMSFFRIYTNEKDLV